METFTGIFKIGSELKVGDYLWDTNSFREIKSIEPEQELTIKGLLIHFSDGEFFTETDYPNIVKQPIAPNRERAIEIAIKAFADDIEEDKGIATQMSINRYRENMEWAIDALINEGLLLGKSGNEEMKWLSIEKDGYPKHNGSFLCKVQIEQECGAIWDRFMVIDYVFDKNMKMPTVMEMKNGVVNEYGCNYFNNDVKEPLTVTHYIFTANLPK